MDGLCYGWRVPQHTTEAPLANAYASDRYASTGDAPLRVSLPLCPDCYERYKQETTGRIILPCQPKAEATP